MAWGWVAGVMIAALLGEMLWRSCQRAAGSPAAIRRSLKRGALQRFALAFAGFALAVITGAHPPALLGGFVAAEAVFAFLGLRALWRMAQG